MKRWHTVEMDELKLIWKQQAEQRICFCGCTHAALIEKYGAKNIKHKMGFGWYKLTERTR